MMRADKGAMEVIHEFEGIRYREADHVYPVREDSLLLISRLKDVIKDQTGTMLEMGCGTGLATLLCSYHGWKTVSIDREPLALRNLRWNLDLNDIRGDLYLSNMFEGLPRRFLGCFDLIIFNPPYLSNKYETRNRREDLALIGGEVGNEIVCRFSDECREFMGINGRVLLLIYKDWDLISSFERADLKIMGRPLIEKDIDGEIFQIIDLMSNI